MWYFAGAYPGLYYPPSSAPATQITDLVIAIPMRVVTGGMTRRVVIPNAAALPMRIHPMVEIPMTRGMFERVEIPMRMHVSVTMERT